MMSLTTQNFVIIATDKSTEEDRWESAALQVTGNAIWHSTWHLTHTKIAVALYISFNRQTVKLDQVFLFHQHLLHYEQVC